jgi:hypothetical protein
MSKHPLIIADMSKEAKKIRALREHPDYCIGASRGYNDDESSRGKLQPRHHSFSEAFWAGYNDGYDMNANQEDDIRTPDYLRKCFDDDAFEWEDDRDQDEVDPEVTDDRS